MWSIRSLLRIRKKEIQGIGLTGEILARLRGLRPMTTSSSPRIKIRMKETEASARGLGGSSLFSDLFSLFSLLSQTIYHYYRKQTTTKTYMLLFLPLKPYAINKLS